MSDTAAESPQPTRATAAKRPIPVVVWLVLLILASGALAAAVYWSGGVGEALNLVGLGSVFGAQPPPREAGVNGAPASVPATASAAATSSVLPASAGAAMYREQVASQAHIGALVDNQIASLTFGDAERSTKSATVPVDVEFRNGSSASGTMTFKKYDGVWYFFSLGVPADGSAAKAVAIDPSVVNVITAQQATEGSQELIENGILGGGFKTARVTSVSKGSGTATVQVALDGGTAAATGGDLLCITKNDGQNTYWFIARFSKQ